MQWTSASEFFAMGGAGLYVWGSYGMTVLAIALECVFLVRRRRTLQAGTGRSPQAHHD